MFTSKILCLRFQGRCKLYINPTANILTLPSGVPVANTKLSSGEVTFIALLGTEREKKR